MKTRTALLWILCTLAVGCTNKQKKQSTAENADDMTIAIADKDVEQDRDTVIYELPQCRLWYTEDLPADYEGETVSMWTEQNQYWENVKVINVLVANPTDKGLSFGRSWNLQVWSDGEWINPESKITGMAWEDDLFLSDKVRALYRFRIPVGDYYQLPAGRYRITKTFWLDEVRHDLTAEFNIPA